MTYQELAEKIAKMDSQQKNSDVTIYDPNIGEFFRVSTLDFQSFSLERTFWMMATLTW